MIRLYRLLLLFVAFGAPVPNAEPDLASMQDATYEIGDRSAPEYLNGPTM